MKRWPAQDVIPQDTDVVGTGRAGRNQVVAVVRTPEQEAARIQEQEAARIQEQVDVVPHRVVRSQEVPDVGPEVAAGTRRETLGRVVAEQEADRMVADC